MGNYKRHMEDTHKDQAVGELAAFKNNLNLEVPFAFSERSPFIYKKTEKLVVATSLVAGLIKDNEVLATQLRSKTFELLTHVSKGLLGKSDVSSGDRSRSAAFALATIAELQTLCDVGYFSKHISEMNATILKKEFAFLYKTIVEEGGLVVGGAVLLSRDFFTEEIQEFHKGHDKGHDMSFMKPPATRLKTSTSEASGGRSTRRDTIIQAIKQAGEVGVNDLVGALKGVGGKTIQRELLAMVADGVLKKQGERRWSRYSII